ISFEVASLKSSVFGVGFGQIKVILFGSSIVERLHWAEDQRIINAVGDTIATFGYLGLFIRFWLEIWLFFKTKVYGDIFRISLFLWIFVYQFTGSFITNVAEYFIWVLAFTNIFPQFDFRIRRKIRESRE
ncbi:membrane protein, partial [Candidatus Thiomargarita nelsonii]